uniref:Putative metalloprotease n=1 Tax=Ixodes ricinus TaxID=34613 RepID=A0A0K8RB86_IXORI
MYAATFMDGPFTLSLFQEWVEENEKFNESDIVILLTSCLLYDYIWFFSESRIDGGVSNHAGLTRQPGLFQEQMNCRSTILSERSSAGLSFLYFLTIHIAQLVIQSRYLPRSARLHAVRMRQSTEDPAVQYPMARIAPAKMEKRCAYLQYALRYKSTCVK